jgi:hypothetical protein
MNFSNPRIKKGALTIVFYAIAALVIYVSDEASPNGACAPGLGVILFMLMIPTSIVLLLVNLYRTVEIDRSNLPSAIIHFLALASIVVWLKIAG